MKTIVTSFAILTCIVCYAQKQTNRWYFGNGAGIDFNSGVAVPVTDGATYLDAIPHCEGTSVICDSSGNLLFYTNGEVLWNWNHQIMTNGSGLLGNLSSTQSSLIVPQPGSSRFFYVFTTDGFLNTELRNGFRYSIVDICEDNGLGAVIPDKKNLLLLDSSNEKVTAVSHANGTDIWIIAQRYYTNQFYAYLLTENGITDTVVSSSGSVHTVYCPNAGSFSQGSIGYMKASNDGTKIAIVNGQACKKISELHRFDKQTGLVSNAIELQADTSANGYYGVAFSPDDTKLYISSWIFSNKIIQFDVSSGDSTTIRNTRQVIASNAGNIYWALQLGSDGKIYVAQRFKQFLSVINNPNNSGAACNYVEDGFSLDGKECSFGLPNFMAIKDYRNGLPNNCLQVYYNATSDTICRGDSVYLNGRWYYDAGTYTDSLRSRNSLLVTILTVVVNDLPTISLGADTTLCAEYIELKAGNFAETIWNTGEQTSVIKANKSNTYQVRVRDAIGCEAEDSIAVVFDCGFVIPNAFTPNGDGKNDYFIPVLNSSGYEVLELLIYNRWGQLVYRGLNDTKGWDGRFNGAEQPVATYVYSLQLRKGNKITDQKGSLTLVR